MRKLISCVRDAEVGGSNPPFPTRDHNRLRSSVYFAGLRAPRKMEAGQPLGGCDEDEARGHRGARNRGRRTVLDSCSRLSDVVPGIQQARYMNISRIRTNGVSCSKARKVGRRFDEKCFYGSGCSDLGNVRINVPPGFDCAGSYFTTDDGATVLHVKFEDANYGTVRFVASS